MAFWKKIFKSKYTGKEIDEAIGQVIEGGGGGSDIFVFYVSEDKNTGDPVFSKTFTEINAAIADGKIPVGFNDPKWGSRPFSEPILLLNSNSSVIIFEAKFFDFDETFSANRNEYVLASDNTITVTAETYTWSATSHN